VLIIAPEYGQYNGGNTMDLGSTQSLAEKSAKNTSWVLTL